MLLRDAVRRGDRYTEATASRVLNVAWLLRDDPEAAREALDRVQWAPLQTDFHLQRAYELRARIDIDLYVEEPADPRRECGRVPRQSPRASRDGATAAR